MKRRSPTVIWSTGRAYCPVFAPWSIHRPKVWRLIRHPGGVAERHRSGVDRLLLDQRRLGADLLWRVEHDARGRRRERRIRRVRRGHGTQRSRTIARASGNGTGRPCAVDPPSPSGRIAIAIAAIASAAVTGISQTLWPACRRLKNRRIQAPIAIRAASTSQPSDRPVMNGKCGDSIASSTGRVR